MVPASSPLLRRAGMVLFLAFLALIVAASLLKEPWLSGWRYWLVRWPAWVIVGAGLPLLAVRIALWRRRSRERASADASRV